MARVIVTDRPKMDPHFHAGQLLVANDPARFRVLRAGRRWGKSRLGVWLALQCALEGGRAWWVAPDYKRAAEGWEPLRLMAQETMGSYAKVNLTDRIIHIANGGTVEVRSADNPQSLRGAGLDLLVLDEAALLPRVAWFQVLRPSLADRQGRALFISTPKGGNWFKELWEDAGDRDGWSRYHFPTSANPFIDAAEIADLARDMPSIEYRQEIEAEFVDLEGARISPGWFRYFKQTHRGGLLWLEPQAKEGAATPAPVDSRHCERFCTVDLAASLKTSADFTVVMSCAAYDGHLFILDVVRRRMEGPDIVPAIQDQFAKHDLKVAHIEATGFQLSLVQEARRDGLPVKELRADREKVARALPLEARMEAGRVWFDRDAAWRRDLETELAQFPVGEHDDQVDALAYAAAAMMVPRLPDWSKSKANVDDLRRDKPVL